MTHGTPAARAPAKKRSAARDTSADLATNPAVLLAGGVAIGVAIGLLIPRLERERKTLEPMGRKLAERASAAVKAAKETGREEVNALLPDRDAAKERVSALFGNVIDAVKEATSKA